MGRWLGILGVPAEKALLRPSDTHPSGLTGGYRKYAKALRSLLRFPKASKEPLSVTGAGDVLWKAV